MNQRGLKISRSTLGNALVLLALMALAGWSLFLHGADAFAPTPMLQPRWMAALATALWLGQCGLMLADGRRHRAAADPSIADWLVIHASQTGFGYELAQRTLDSLQRSGHTAALHDIASLDADGLHGRNCLFIASTTGEGDPPDGALAFSHTTMAATFDLHDCRYAILALGDRNYAQFCAFGQRLDAWLRGNAARPLFDRVDVDNADHDALQLWQQRLGSIICQTDDCEISIIPQFERWILTQRQLLNPDSPGWPAFHLELVPSHVAVLNWQAGDIVEVVPRNPEEAVSAFLAATGLSGTEPVSIHGQSMPLSDALARSHLPLVDTVRGSGADTLATALRPLPHRDYSIASLPSEGKLELLVRLMCNADGTHGICSSWLCGRAALGTQLDVRIRSNPGFHAPDPSRPMILVGNGTGIAGLRAHLKARIAEGAHRNWLLFGERSAAHDDFFGDELERWLQTGGLEHLDRTFSRDGGTLRYVQDALSTHAPRLRQWLDAGASLYVCGSAQGMAPAVDALLVDLLGTTAVNALIHEGRYRRDVY